jgi:hypothetical protein
LRSRRAFWRSASVRSREGARGFGGLGPLLRWRAGSFFCFGGVRRLLFSRFLGTGSFASFFFSFAIFFFAADARARFGAFLRAGARFLT